MSNIQSAYINALLADASYVKGIKTGEIPRNDQDLKASLTQTQADFLAANFTVRSVIETPNTINPLLGTGFDAVVWEGKSGTPYAGQVFVSMRGTDGGTDIADDLILATTGLPYDQIRDMVNWWLRNTASTSNNSVPQIKVDVSLGEFPLRAFALDTPTSGTGALNGLGAITAVNGHSLGGYLATAFTRLFGAGVQAVNTFNSAGFSDAAGANIRTEYDRLVSLLGINALGTGSFEAAGEKQTNFRAGNGVSVTTNNWGEMPYWALGFNQYGAKVALNQEDTLGGNPIANHSMFKLTDMLALGAALEKLDASLTIARFNDMVKAGSHLAAGGLEGVLDSMRRILQGPEAEATPIGDVGDNAESRAAYHRHLRALQESEVYQNLAGKLTLQASKQMSNLQAQAKTDFDAFLSLHGLSPIVLSTGGNAAAASALQAVHPSLYADWNADRNARLYGDEGYEYSYSEQWYADRSSMLGLMLTRNEVDGNGHFTMRSLPQDLRLWDLDSGTRLYLNNSSNEGPATESYPKQHITFGTALADLMVGDAYADRLYGGGGLDQLNGGDGRDHLEGGVGSDSLYGERGNDTLHGGADGDWLEGGEGNDSLVGGTGIDTYRFSGAFGRDTIVDRDGQGRLSVESGLLSGGKRVAGGVSQWISSNGLTTFTLVPQSTGVQDLLISHRAAPNASALPSTITVKDWTNGQLGITLEEAPPAPPPPNTLGSGFIKATNPLSGEYLRSGENYVSAGADPSAQDLIFGTAAGELLHGGGGNDALIGREGNDVLHGGAGADVLLGGSGRDLISGGTGDDFIHGSGLSDGFIGPTNINTVPPSSSGVELARGFGWVVYDPPGIDANGINVVLSNIFTAQAGADEGNYIEGGEGNDLISAGRGNDVVSGGEHNDIIWGMDGADVLSGDAGNDRLEGDAGLLPGYLTHTPLIAHSDDILQGGAGNDTLVGHAGHDLLYGGADNDQLYGDSSGNARTSADEVPGSHHGKDYLDGGGGDDQLVGGGGDDELVGGTGSDVIIGDDIIDRLQAVHHGSDLVQAGAGNDTVEGGGGSDVVHGDEGDDVLVGDDFDYAVGVTFGDDTLHGGDGNDYLAGDNNQTTSTNAGLGGHDVLYGERGADSLDGGGGNDLLDGGADNDVLLGQAGSDTLVGGAGADYLDGGDGDDTYAFGSGDFGVTAQGAPDTVVDAHGNNRVVFSGADPAAIQAVAAVSGILRLDFKSGDQLAVLGGASFGASSGSFTYEFADGATYSAARLIGSFSSTPLRGAGFAFGGRGSDNLQLMVGSGRISGGAGDDNLLGSGGNNTYFFSRGDGRDSIRDTSKADAPSVIAPNRLVFEQGYVSSAVRLTLGTGTNGGAAGDLVLQLGNEGDSISIGGFQSSNALGRPQIDTFTFEDGTTLTYAQLLQRGFDIQGTSLADTQAGTNLSDRFSSSAGNDTMRGGAGADSYSFRLGAGSDLIEDRPGSPLELDTLVVGSGLTSSDLVLTRAGDDLRIAVRGGVDQVIVAKHFAGEAIERVQFDNGTVWDGAAIAANISRELTDGPDTFTGSDAPDVIDGKGGNDRIFGRGGSDAITGGAGNDTLEGEGSDDTLFGGDGADSLDGGDGHDRLEGGAGNDSLTGRSGNNTYVFGRGDGADLLNSFPNDPSAIKQNTLLLRAGVSPSEVGVRQDHTRSLIVSITGTTDTFTVPSFFTGETAATNPLQRVQFADGTVWSWQTVRDLVFAGTASSDDIVGTRSADSISGGAGNDTLSGEQGDDTLNGGLGVDVLHGGAGNDTLIDGEVLSGGTGNDTFVVNDWPRNPLTVVDTSGNDTLVLPADVTPANLRLNLAVTGSAVWNSLEMLLPGRSVIQVTEYFNAPDADSIDAIRFADGTVWGRTQVMALMPSARLSDANDSSVRGYLWNDNLDGLGGNDWIDGRQGNDTLFGGTGKDSLYGGEGNDSVSGGAGDDSLFGDTDSSTSTGAGNDQLLGGDGNDTLFGAGGQDTLDGGAGDDRVNGGDGDDVYVLTRSSGNDILFDSAGNDRIVVGAGIAPSEVSVVGHGGDLVIVVAGSSTQLWLTRQADSASFRIERVEFANQTVWLQADLTSRATGAGTANTMTGSAGNDTYRVDHPNDVIVEATGGGIDSVSSSVNYTLPNEVENITLTGSLNIRATGNRLSNQINGNGGNNLLISGADNGDDTIRGGAGDDTYDLRKYYWSSAGPTSNEDLVVELSGQGVDTVLTDAYHYTLDANVETLISSSGDVWNHGPGKPIAAMINGNSADNVIDASVRLSTNRIDGGLGNDTLIGGKGNDTFVVDSAGDVVVEAPENTSVDTVESALSWQLASGIENLKLLGSSATSGTGNTGANVLDGSRATASNVLAGLDGDDIYLVDASDKVVELANGGNDKVIIAAGAATSYSLSAYANIEALQLGQAVGAAGLVGTQLADQLVGNTSGNVILGGDGDDVLLDAFWPIGTPTWGPGDWDRLEGGVGNDTLVSTSGPDTLIGGAGNDSLSIGENSGSATIVFGRGDGADMVTLSGAGARMLVLDSSIAVGDLLVARSQRDLVLSFGQGDSMTLRNYFADLNSTVASGQFTALQFADGVALSQQMLISRMASGNSNSSTEAADVMLGSAAPDVFDGLGGDDVIFGAGGADTLTGGAGADTVMAGDGDDSLAGGSGSDLLQGGLGSDFLEGGGGNDTLFGSAGQDTLAGGAGDDLLDPGSEVEFDVIRFGRGSGADRVTGYGAYGDEVQFETGVSLSDLRFSRSGTNLVISILGATDTLTVEQFMNYGNQVSLRFSDGTTWRSPQIWQALTAITGTDMADNLIGTDFSERINANGGNDTVDSGAGNDLIQGGLGDDSLKGGAGYDTLDGGAGIDRMTGGSEDDMYVVDNTGDVVVEASGEGHDRIEASVSYTIPNNVEEMYLTGSANLTATGNALDNYISGNVGNNTLLGGSGSDWIGDYEGGNDSLDGGEGDDTLEGGLGDDTYVVNSTLDQVYEYADEGSDLIRASVSFTLPDEVERLTLTGTSGLSGTGNALANTLIGNSGANRLDGGHGNDTIDGGSGSDTMIGGGGDDAYYVNATTDVVTEAAGAGVDTIFSSVTLTTLAANVENVTLLGSANLNATGNALANVLIGSSGANSLSGGDGNDTIDGGSGNDTMAGGVGHDSYVVDLATDVVTEAANEGIDTIRSGVTLTLGSNLENLHLTGALAINGMGNALDNALIGNSANNMLTGGAGNDTLDGGAGNDTMSGGVGNDTYMVDAASDVVTELSSEGTDLVNSAVTYTLLSHIENLTLTGTSAINGTGNASDNALTGNSANNMLTGGAGNDTLNGGAGNDTMAGGVGSDTYMVDAASDVVTELSGEGTDLVNSAVTYTLLSHIENLTLTGTLAINGTGNSLDNALTGNSANNMLTGGAGNDTLDGGAGNDTMAGGVGNDSYVVNLATDVVTEAANEGIDTIRSGVTLTLGINVENMQLLGTSAINGTGNTLNNLLVGNSSANTLSGAAGNDTLDGAAGNDSLVGGAGADGYRFGLGYGTDTVNENDTTAGVTDVVEFTGNLTQASIQFRRVGNNLEASILASSDKLILQNWYLGVQHQVEQFRFSDGTTLTNSQVQASALSAPAAMTASVTEFATSEGDAGRKKIPTAQRRVALGAENLSGLVMVRGGAVAEFDNDSGEFGSVMRAASASGGFWRAALQDRQPGRTELSSAAVGGIDQQTYALLDAMAMFGSSTETTPFATLQDTRLPFDRLAASVAIP